MEPVDQRAKHLLSPDYWGGHDIFQEQTFAEVAHSPNAYLSNRELNYARRCLRQSVGQVAIGNGTEVRYRADNEFDTDLKDGSLVVMDSESILKWTYDDPEYVWQESIQDDSPNITRPYSSHWLKCQDGTINPIPVGSESVVFQEELAIYVRLLRWGILVTRDQARAIQPFNFNIVKLLPNGQVYMPPYRRRDPLHAPVTPLPISIGEVDVLSPLYLKTCSIGALERMRSIDVVYPASGEGQRASKPKKALGRLALPKLRISQV